MNDILRMDYINSLPPPLMAQFYDGSEYEVYSICVETGLMKINVCGMLDNCEISDVKVFIDIDGAQHDPDSFYIDYED